MGEFTHSGKGQIQGLSWADEDVFTFANFVIAMIAAFIGYIAFEHLRSKC